MPYSWGKLHTQITGGMDLSNQLQNYYGVGRTSKSGRSLLFILY